MGRRPRGCAPRTSLRFAALIWTFLFFSGLCSLATAQSDVDGAVVGHVTDPSGAAVPGALITLSSGETTGAARTAGTARDGSFELAGVAVGTYRIAIQADGFSRLVESVTVELGSVAHVEAALQIGAVTTTVTVDAGEARQTQLGVDEVFRPSEIDQLPVDGRRWQSFATLMPGVNSGSTTDSSALSFRGVSTTQNSSQVDGISNDQSFGGVPIGTGADAGRETEAETGSGGESGVGGDGSRALYGRHAGAAYTFSQAAVREFEVHTQNYSAQDGRAVGGVVTTVSRHGTDEIHGAGFYVVRDSAWAATNPFSIATTYKDGVVTDTYVKPHDLLQQFGASLGGPLRRGKLFYFATVDEQLRGFPAVSSPQNPNFYALTATQQTLLGVRGVTSTQTNAALNYLDSLTGTVARREDQGIQFAKLDWNATRRNQLSTQYNRVRWSNPAGVRTAPVIDRGLASMGNAYGKVDAGVLRWMNLWSSQLSHELRVAFTRDFEYETAQTPLPQEPTIGPGGYAPEVSISPQGFVFGTPASLGRLAYPDEHRLQLAERLNWVKGRHVLQFGADLSFVNEYINALGNQEGTYHFDSGATGGRAGGLVDWITDYTFNANVYPNGGCPSILSPVHEFCFRSYTQSFGQQIVRFKTQEWAGYIQDGWRVGEHLTVNAGLRYEYEFEPLPQQPNAALDAVFGARGATSVIPEDRNNFGPRLGLAWEPHARGHGWGHETIRLGYGVYYGRLAGVTIRQALVNTALPSSTTRIRILPSAVAECPQVPNQGFGYGCSYLSEPPAAIAATTTATVFDRRFRLPMAQQGTFGIERELGAGTLLRAAYVLNLDRQLPNSVDINIAPSTGLVEYQLQGGPVNGSGPIGVTNGETFVIPRYTARISPLYGPVTDIVSNADATYNGLVTELVKQSRGGLAFRIGWTWSKALDFGQNTSAIPKTNGQFDPFNIRYDKGLSTLNFPHKVTASAIWTPHLGARWAWMQQAVVRDVANGWAISPLFRATSGRPYSYEVFGGTRLIGGHESLNGSGGAVYLPTVGRNTLRLPENVTVDLRVSRSFRLADQVRLRGAAEVFNVANHVNYTNITTRAYLLGPAVNGIRPLIFQDAATVAAEGLNVLPFGTYTASSASGTRERRAQLGLRLEF